MAVICPPITIGLTDPEKSEGVAALTGLPSHSLLCHTDWLNYELTSFTETRGSSWEGHMYYISEWESEPICIDSNMYV